MTDTPVLVADDDLVTRETLAIALRLWGYSPISVSTGQEAIDVLKSGNCPALAIIDYRLPDVEGPEICKAIRSSPSSSYVYMILLTMLTDREARLHGLDAGADDFLSKPFDPDELRLRLRTGSRIIDLQDQMRSVQRALQVRLDRDSLTGAASREAVINALQREHNRAIRINAPFGLLMIDLDHFKEINDQHGHTIGDGALRTLAGTIQSVLRPYDTCGRFGGDEFLVVLPNATTEQCRNVADRIHKAINSTKVHFGDQSIDVTISVGIATTDHCGTGNGPQDFIEAADTALYLAKQAGRNCVHMFDDEKVDIPGGKSQTSEIISPPSPADGIPGKARFHAPYSTSDSNYKI